ncbi:MAG: OmpA family protein [Deltaproteobacteria bacterium]|jgi:chemotaxis protein MotB|nr:OmpA family protein [Deltaproteobacteria bacterium]
MARPKLEPTPIQDSTMVLFTSIVLIILTFFIMMTAKANYDEVKHGKVVESIYNTFGLMSGGYAAIGEETGLSTNLASIGDPSARLVIAEPEMARIRALLAPDLSDGQARIIHNKGQRVISLSADLLFNKDSSELSPEAQETLMAFSRIMRQVPIPIYVEGHTDNLPSGLEGQDNWDISTDRALAVLNYFVEPGQMDKSLLAAYGYAGFKPMVANNSPANRAKNNRVDLILDFEAARASDLKNLQNLERSFEFEGFEFLLPAPPSQDESEVY